MSVSSKIFPVCVLSKVPVLCGIYYYVPLRIEFSVDVIICCVEKMLDSYSTLKSCLISSKRSTSSLN